MIEVELRSFVDEATYARLEKHFRQTGKLTENTRQITHYLEHPVDTRIQLSQNGGRVWQKLGKMHESQRQEFEIKMSRTDAQSALEIFKNLGLGIKVSWFRHRLAFEMNGLSVTLDNTVGYGRILEVEILCEESAAAQSEAKLREFITSLGLAPAQKTDFDAAFAAYVKDWHTLTAACSAQWLDEK